MTHSLDWLREVKPELKALDQIPLTGAPPFPWDDLSARLGKTFECEQLTIQPKELTWRSKEDLFENLGGSPYSFTLNIPALNGEAYWVIPEEEISVLENLLLTKDIAPLTRQDQTLKDSFYRFLILETLYSMSQTACDKALIPILIDNKVPPSIDALCLDITITIQERVLWGRLIIPPTLRQSLVDYFIKKEASKSSEELAKKVEIPVHLEIGQTKLTVTEWKEIGLGDFLLLDHCLLKPDDFNGEVSLTVNGRAAFKGELSDGRINILEIL